MLYFQYYKISVIYESKRQMEHFLIWEVVYLATEIFTVKNISLFITYIKWK